LTTFFYAVTAAYVAIIILEAVETRGHSSGVRRQARWTLFLFFCADALAVVGGFVEYHYAGQVYPAASFTGLGLLVAKVVVKRACMRTLGEYYSVHIVVGESHELVRSGLYRYVRHPAYMAHFLGVTGICLMLNAFFVMLVLVPLDAIFLAIRIRLEENELTARFGREYAEYKREVWAVVPFKNLFRKRQPE
jgi:protein-S-isoprenylcysteine O-methyltransferase Ste14